MLRLRSWLPAVVLALVWTQAASAHFLWLLTGTEKAPNKVKVQVFFGEAAEADDPALLDKVAKAEVWSVGGRGEPKLLTLTKGADALEAELAGPARDSTLILKHNYGVLAKGGSEPFLLMYYAKTHPFAMPGTWRAVKDDVRLPLEISPTIDGSSTLLQVTWKGKPVAGSAVTVVGPGIDKKIKGATDEAGNFRCELPKAGTFSIRAKHTEEAAGKFDDKEYKSVRHYSTLTLHNAPSRLTPVAHNLPALPKGTTSFGGAIAGDALFVFGGNYGGAHEYNNEEQSGNLWTLDLKNPTKWNQLSGGRKLQGLAMVKHKGLLYRVGGFSAKNKNGDKQDLNSQAEFARMKPGSLTWEDLPSLPEARSSHDAAIVGDTLFVVGGWNMTGGGGSSKWHDTVLSMNLASDELVWKTIAAPSFKRRALALAAHQGKLFCLGGMQEQSGTTTDVAIYDPQTNAWSEGPALLGGSMDGFGSSTFACGGSLFATTMSGSIQRLSDDGKSWEFLGQLAPPAIFPSRVTVEQLEADRGRRSQHDQRQSRRLGIVVDQRQEDGCEVRASGSECRSALEPDASAFRLTLKARDARESRALRKLPRGPEIGELPCSPVLGRDFVSDATLSKDRLVKISSLARSAFWMLLLGWSSFASAGDWTRFQGPMPMDVDVSRLPMTWSPKENVAWTADITGYGQSSPVTWGERVFVTSISGPKKERCHVAAFDLNSGKKLWQHDLDAATQAENNNYISKAAPTPVVDAAGVVCFFE